MLDQEIRERTPTGSRPSVHRWLIAAVAALAVAVIGVGAWALVERNRADDLSSDLAAAETDLSIAEAQIVELESAATDVVVVGGGSLTERQQEMVDLVTGPFMDAWTRGDGDAVAASFAPDAVMYDMEGGEVLSPADGTLQAFAADWSGIAARPGMLVHGDRVLFVVTLAGIDVGNVLEFTPSGELLIESHAMYGSELGPRN